MKIKLFSVIVPSYRQALTIEQDLISIKDLLNSLKYPYEIICVVDGHIDQTLENAQKIARKYKQVKVIGYETNKGKGYAVRFGMAASRGDVVAFIDAGMDLNPRGLEYLLKDFEAKNADVIVGSKRHEKSKVNYPWQRKILSLGYQFLVFILFGLKIRDTQVGLKVFKREVLEKVMPRLLVKRFAFDIEMLAVANYLGFKKIYEAPIDIKLHFGGVSTITSQKFIRTVVAMFLDTLAVFYRLKILNYYSDKNKRKWRYDSELNFRVNIV